MEEGCTHGPREGVHRPVHLFSKIWTRRPRPWGARFAEISPFQESVSRNFLDPEPICQPTFDRGIFSVLAFCPERAFSALVRLFRIVSASFPRSEIGVSAPFPRSHRNDEHAYLPRPKPAVAQSLMWALFPRSCFAVGAFFPRSFGLFGQSARFSRARKSVSAHLFRAHTDIASMVTPLNVAGCFKRSGTPCASRRGARTPWRGLAGEGRVVCATHDPPEATMTPHSTVNTGTFPFPSLARYPR